MSSLRVHISLIGRRAPSRPVPPRPPARRTAGGRTSRRRADVQRHRSLRQARWRRRPPARRRSGLRREPDLGPVRPHVGDALPAPPAARALTNANSKVAVERAGSGRHRRERRRDRRSWRADVGVGQAGERPRRPGDRERVAGGERLLEASRAATATPLGMRHDADDAGHRRGRGGRRPGVDRARRCRAGGPRRGHCAGHVEVQRVLLPAGDDVAGVLARRRAADERELRWPASASTGTCGSVTCGRLGGELAVGRARARRARITVDCDVVSVPGVDVPALRGRRDQPGARGGGERARRLVQRADRARGSPVMRERADPRGHRRARRRCGRSRRPARRRRASRAPWRCPGPSRAAGARSGRGCPPSPRAGGS